MAGAVGDEIDIVAERMVKEKTIRVDRARQILEELRKTNKIDPQ
jgi:hydroxymethylglutaryl-CoA reductase